MIRSTLARGRTWKRCWGARVRVRERLAAGRAKRVARGDLPRGDAAREGLHLRGHVVAELVRVKGEVGGHLIQVAQLGGYRVQGNSPESAQQILDDAIALEKAGAFALVLECVPSSLAEKISSSLKIPVIGIGAGRNVDAQVLVFHDLVGLSGEFKPRFVRRYAQGEQLFQSAVKSFIDDVSSGSFPADSETFLDRDGENSEMTPEV